MFSSKTKNRPKKRLLQIESLEQREMLSVAPLLYPVHVEQPVYSSNFSTEAVAAPAPTPSDITATSVKLTWNATTMTGLRPEDPFKIEKSTTDSAGAEKWVQVGSDIPYSYTINTGTYSYELKGLTSSTEYKLRVSFGSTVLGRGYTEAATVSTLESELNAEALSSTSIKLSWNIAGKTGTWFTIQKRLVGETVWVETGLQVKADGSATATKTSTVEGLTAATAYEFQVTYNDTATPSVVHSSQTKACTTLFVLNAADGTVNSVNLAWNAAMGGTAHEIQIYTGTAKPTETTAWSKATVESTANPTEYKITGLKENLSYYFRVRYTVTENGESVTKYTDVLHYSTPTSIKLENATEKSINVSWTFSGTSGTPYYIQYKTGGNWIDYPGGANTTSKSYTLNNLDAGTTYEIRVRYTNSSGTAYSAAATLKTGVATKLENVTASSAEISWNIPGLSGTVNIQRCDGSLDPAVDTNWRTIATGVSGTTYTNNNIGSNNKYYYRVSYPSGGETLYTIHVSALTNATVTASEASQDSVKLDWNFTPKQGTSLTVQFCQSDNPPPAESSWGIISSASVTRDSDDLGCTVNGLQPGFNYFFRVLYTSSLGTEQQTSSVTKRIGTIGDNLIASEITDTAVTLRWAKTGFTSQQSKGFIVYCQDLSGAYGTNGVDNQWKPIATVDASQNHYTVSGLRGDTRYNFKIAYAGDSENQAVSMQLDLTTKPFTVDVLDLTQTSAKLEWSFSTDKDPAANTSPSGDGTGTYIIQRYTGTGEPGETERNLAVGDSNWQEIGTAPYNMPQPRFNLSAPVQTLTKNTTYYYRIVYTYRTGLIENSSAGSGYTVPLETKFSEIVTVKTKSDIRTSSIGSNSINIAWDAKTGTTNYTVQYRVSGAGGWTPYGTVTGTSTICTGLNADTEYEFQVLYNGTGTETATVTAKTAKNLLSIASKELGIGTASVTVEMQYAAGESNFVLKYRQKGEETDPWQTKTPDSTANNTVSFELPGLIPETEYEFKIVYDANSQSHETEVKSVSLSDDLMPANVSGTSITIRWEDAGFPDKRTGTSYVLQYRVVGGTAWLNGPAPSSNSSTVSSLAANTEYEFRVQYTSDGGTAYSTHKTVQTKQPTVNVSTPQVGAVKLTWTFESVDGYIVQYKTGTGTWVDTVIVSANTSREATVTNLPLETEYTFRIAYKTSQSLAANETVYSDEAEITTLSGFSVVENSIGSQSVSVKWDYVTDSTYRLQYRIAGTQNWIEIIPDIAKSTKTYTLSSLTPGTSYTIQLVYVDGTEQTVTVTVTAATTKVAPEAPTGLSVSEIKSDGAKIKWTDNSEYEDDYIIEVISNVTGKVVKTSVGEGVGTGEMAQTLTGLDTKTSYTVKIYAKNTEGSSAIAQATFTTLDVSRPAAVTTVKAVTTPKSITLSWKIKPTTDIPNPTQFRIEYYDDKAADREKLWYEVQLAPGAITPDSTPETYSCTISNDFSIGESLTITLENKTAYQFRIIALAPSVTYGNAAATAISATTAALVTPSSLSAKDITLTTATISFKDTDKNVAAAEKVYTLYYAPGAKKYTDWSKVPAPDIQSVTVSSSDLKTTLTGLKAETVYSYIIESDYHGEKTTTKPSSFTTAKMPLATTVKGGYTLVGGAYSFLISWKPPATKVLAGDVVINYSLEVSISGKKDTFVTLPLSTVSSTSTLRYTAAEFADVVQLLADNNYTITNKVSAIYFRVAGVFVQNGMELGTSYSANGRIALPKFV